ncbi:hypothetical protein HED49_14930 [Ochrobactrum daejeonense]|nr:hypothetical protein [Brucella daejeonensis]
MAGKRDLLTRVEFTGYWWIDAESERNVAGVFTYDPQEGCTLALHGDLWEQPDGEIPDPKRPIVIWRQDHSAELFGASK